MFLGVWYICCDIAISTGKIPNYDENLHQGTWERIAWGRNDRDLSAAHAAFQYLVCTVPGTPTYGQENQHRKSGCHGHRTSLGPGSSLW